MSDAFVVDPFEMAKEFQWEIERLSDPIDAALRANQALSTLNLMNDSRMTHGAPLHIKALSAYAFRHWDEEDQEYAIEQFDPFGAEGSSGGIGFVQNLSPRLPIQTLFLAVKNVSLVENNSVEAFIETPPVTVSTIAIPVLDLQLVEVAA